MQKDDVDRGDDVRVARCPQGGKVSRQLKAIVVTDAEVADANVEIVIIRRQGHANWTMLDNLNESHNN